MTYRERLVKALAQEEPTGLDALLCYVYGAGKGRTSLSSGREWDAGTEAIAELFDHIERTEERAAEPEEDVFAGLEGECDDPAMAGLTPVLDMEYDENEGCFVDGYGRQYTQNPATGYLELQAPEIPDPDAEEAEAEYRRHLLAKWISTIENAMRDPGFLKLLEA